MRKFFISNTFDGLRHQRRAYDTRRMIGVEYDKETLCGKPVPQMTFYNGEPDCNKCQVLKEEELRADAVTVRLLK